MSIKLLRNVNASRMVSRLNAAGSLRYKQGLPAPYVILSHKLPSVL